VHLVEDAGVRLVSRLERGDDVHLSLTSIGRRLESRLFYPMHALAVLSRTHRLARRPTLDIADLADESLLLLRMGQELP
jgi:LysR family transcriptional regulator, cyn operon transcriptional activator